MATTTYTPARTYPIKECLHYLQGLTKKPVWDKLTITPQAYMKLLAYTHLMDGKEVTGFGRVKDGKVIDFKILEQEVTGTTADATAEAITKFMMSLPEEQIQEWCIDWHTHPTFSTTPSGTDWTNYAEMYNIRMNNQFIIMIFNESGDLYCKNYINPQRVTPITVTVEDYQSLSDDIIERIYNLAKSDVLTHCKKKEYQTTYSSSYWTKEDTDTEKKKTYTWQEIQKQKTQETDDTLTITSNRCAWCGATLRFEEEINSGVCYDCMDDYQISYGYDGY